MPPRIQIETAIKSGSSTYFGNFSQFIGRTIGFWIATVVGLLAIAALMNAIFKADNSLEIRLNEHPEYVKQAIQRLPIEPTVEREMPENNEPVEVDPLAYAKLFGQASPDEKPAPVYTMQDLVAKERADKDKLKYIMPDSFDRAGTLRFLNVFGRKTACEELETTEAGRKLMNAAYRARAGFLDGLSRSGWAKLIPYFDDIHAIGMTAKEKYDVYQTFHKINEGGTYALDELIRARLFFIEGERESQKTKTRRIVIGMSIGKLILMGLLVPVAGFFILRTFQIRRVNAQEEYPFATLLGLGCLLSVVLVLSHLTVMFWANIFPGFAKVVLLPIIGFEILFKGVIVLAMCHVISNGSSVKESIGYAWATVTSTTGNFIGFHLLAILIGLSGILIVGLGIFVTFPLTYVMWAVAYQQMTEAPTAETLDA